MPRIPNITIRNANLLPRPFRNFSGEASKFNREGDRNFCVVIEDPGMADALIRDGWNIKVLAPRDPDELPKHYLQVTVSFKNIPPEVYMKTRRSRTQLTDATINSLDYADITNVGLTIRPYQWEVNGKTGTKAYLKTMVVSIEADEIAEDYYAELEAPDGDDPF